MLSALNKSKVERNATSALHQLVSATKILTGVPGVVDVPITKVLIPNIFKGLDYTHCRSYQMASLRVLGLMV